MFICKHEVQYYETDRMGITHHSNYVRWMEEARTFFLRRELFLLLFLCGHWILSPARLPIPPLRKV